VEAVVVGSAFVGTVLDALDRGEDPLPALVGLARSLKEALSSSR
jgi:tryptophan synthase alpha subunit